MSGFEALGIILALYPVLLDAFRGYQKLKSGQCVDSLIKDLETEQIIFAEFVGHLLFPNVPEAELADLLDWPVPTYERWQEDRLQLQLLNFCSSRKTDLILSTLTDIQNDLELIQKDLRDTAASGGNYMTRWSSTFSTLRHTRRGSTFRERVKELHSHNERLRRLLDPPRLPVQSGSAKTFRVNLIHQGYHALQIYDALRNGFRCHCDRPHSTKFGMPQLNELLRPASRTNVPRSQRKASYKLLFALDEDSNTDACSQSATSGARRESSDLLTSLDSDSTGADIEAGDIFYQQAQHDGQRKEALSSMDSSITLTSSVARSSGSRSCSVYISECVADRSDAIQDLCNFLKVLADDSSLRPEGSICILPSKKAKYELQSAVTPGDPTSQTIMSLDDLFTSNQCKPTRQYRIGLALRLSHAVLQFYSTPWISTRWSWRDFSIVSTEDHRLDEAHLFLSHDFYSCLVHPQTPQNETKPIDEFLSIVIGEPILTRLGFALVELAIGRRLQELSTDRECQMESLDMRDFATASRILDSGQIQEEEGKIYEDVVRACLRHQYMRKFELRSLNSHEPTFQKEAEQVIIAPLNSMWAEAWGHGMRQQAVF